MFWILVHSCEAFPLGGHACHHQPALWGTELWITDCTGRQISQVRATANGDYRYRAGHHEWSSHDTRMGAVQVNLPPGHNCTHKARTSWVRCIQIPAFYSWCIDGATIAAVTDHTFPLDAETTEDFRGIVDACVPQGSRTQRVTPKRAYNVLAVQRQRERRDTDTLVVMVIVVIILCCCCDRR